MDTALLLPAVGQGRSQLLQAALGALPRGLQRPSPALTLFFQEGFGMVSLTGLT